VTLLTRAATTARTLMMTAPSCLTLGRIALLLPFCRRNWARHTPTIISLAQIQTISGVEVVMDNAEESAAIMPQSERPSLQQVASSESKRNVLDEGLHPSAHHEGKRYSFKMEEPSILISEEDSLINDDDDDDDYAATASSGASFCDASQSSEADPIYLRRGMSFSTDGNLTDSTDFYPEDGSGGSHDLGAATPDMIADHAIRRAQEAGFDDLSEDALEAEINRQLEEEEALRKKKAAMKNAEAKSGTA
jgi:hypothetical protein